MASTGAIGTQYGLRRSRLARASSGDGWGYLFLLPWSPDSFA